MKDSKKTPKLKVKKLQLNFETLHTLDASELDRVVGGQEEPAEKEITYTNAACFG